MIRRSTGHQDMAMDVNELNEPVPARSMDRVDCPSQQSRRETCWLFFLRIECYS